MTYIVEVCAGGINDCIIAQECGAHRVELNSAVNLGGLTPSFGTFLEAKRLVSLIILVMIRPRGGGFLYSKEEIDNMFLDAKLFLENGADGIIFGFLNADRTVNTTLTKQMVELAHYYGKEAVFHRAFDCCDDLDKAATDIIECGADRILTSGQQVSAYRGKDTLKYLKQHYGQAIQFCMASGIRHDNIIELLEDTGIQQVHGSFRTWLKDPTTRGKEVSYCYSKVGDFGAVGKDILIQFMSKINSFQFNENAKE